MDKEKILDEFVHRTRGWNKFDADNAYSVLEQILNSLSDGESELAIKRRFIGELYTVNLITSQQFVGCQDWLDSGQKPCGQPLPAPSDFIPAEENKLGVDIYFSCPDKDEYE